ncbi:ASCH domain-containing protein [Acinetobacter modestus]|uniref:ASCH domain-containing protein n=1 Tax=Acinetobacter TaxID=469 RepID=UPI001F4AA25D|nr:ASCH domain-containing protein [Acinetobacter modestus]MCH7386955.1 ASCH domain-containing protein [Acinetobacter modestus]
MSTAVLLSIKPKFAEAIFSGEKKYEFRKAIYKNPSIKVVYVYASAPISKVIGSFQVDEILKNDLATLWENTNAAAGITEEYFHEYFADRSYGFALKVEKAKLFDEPMKLIEMFGIEHPPQSFCYVPLKN